jgi:hypothetical protein
MLMAALGANVFIVTVRDCAMFGKFLSERDAMGSFIGHEGALALLFSRTIGAISATRVPSTWKLRADPPRSTRVSTVFLSNCPPARRPTNVSSASTAFPEPSRGARPPTRIASRRENWGLENGGNHV